MAVENSLFNFVTNETEIISVNFVYNSFDKL